MTKEEFKICFDSYFDQVRNYIYYRSGDGDLATDVAQEAFMKVWEKDFDYDPDKTISLIYKIAKELWVSRFRKQKNEETYKVELNAKEKTINQDDLYDYNQLKEEYENALSSMSTNQKEVFMMSRMEQLNYQEIAIRLSISKKAVEKRMSKALAFLRERIKPLIK